MRRVLMLSAIVALLAGPALAQKAGGTLRVSHRDNPPSASIHEEATISTVMPFMAVYNNLVVFDPDSKQNRPDRIVPDLATEWTWGNDGKDLTFKLREGVKWHDGKPFTSADVKCTWDMLIAQGLQAAQEPAPVLVLQPQGGDDQRRLRGHLPSRPAAALAAHHARRRHVAGLSLPRQRGADAHASDRHRPVQVRRVPAERIRSSW